MTMEEQCWNAEEYNNHSSIQLEAAKTLLSRVRFNGQEQVLDVGCGDGKITAMIAACVPQGGILGIDRSKQMLHYASEYFGGNQTNNINFILQDAEKISYHEEFDVVFSSFALHWLKNFGEFAEKACRALKQQGKVVFTIPLDMAPLLEIASREISQKSEWISYFHEFQHPWNLSKASEYGERMKAAGFKLEVFEKVTHKKIFTSRSDFENYVIQWHPYLRYIPSDKKQLFFRQIVDRYLELEPIVGAGKIRFEFGRVDIIASKMAL